MGSLRQEREEGAIFLFVAERKGGGKKRKSLPILWPSEEKKRKGASYTVREEGGRGKGVPRREEGGRLRVDSPRKKKVSRRGS